jgi:hypothetical protein
MSALPPVDPAAVIREQVQAEIDANGDKIDASTVREIMAAQALLDARSAPSVILIGEMSTGKTHSLHTLLMDKDGKFVGPSVSGIEKVVMINHEGGFEDVLGDIPPEKLAWYYLPVSEGSFAGLQVMVRTINQQHPDVIQKMGGINKSNYQEFDKLLGVCENFVDQRTGKTLGPVFKFPQNWCLWYESISALSEIAKNNAIGDKPFMELRDYQMVQNPVRKFLNHLVFSTKCLFVATAHLEPEINENTNLVQLNISTVGKKLGPLLPRFFSDMLVTERIDTQGNNGQYTSKFTWSTVKPGIRTKTRNMPFGAGFIPDFRPLLENFNKRRAAGKAASDAATAAIAAGK